MAVMVTFVAALVQTWAQGRVSSTHAAILYTLEPAVASVFAYFALGEQLGWRQAIGAILIVTGVLASKLGVASRVAGRDEVKIKKDAPAIKVES
jgi:drug/metabolite transporter (DMT)-like permease